MSSGSQELNTDIKDQLKTGRIELLKSEYKIVWDYYLKTLDERSKVFDIYFKIVALPFGLVGAFILLVRTSIPRDHKVSCDDLRNILNYTDRITTGGSLFFFLASLSGMICFAYYSMESGNSTLYLNAARELRRRIFNDLDLDSNILPSGFTSQTHPRFWETISSIRFIRGMILAVLNSAFVFVGLWFWSDVEIPSFVDNYKVQSISMFLIVLIGHVIVGERLSRSKSFSSQVVP